MNGVRQRVIEKLRTIPRAILTEYQFYVTLYELECGVVDNDLLSKLEKKIIALIGDEEYDTAKLNIDKSILKIGGGENMEKELISENGLNQVWRLSHYHYEVINKITGKLVAEIKHQKGARDTEGSVNGVLDMDLLYIALDRMQFFNQGELCSEHNDVTIKALKEAIVSQENREADRRKRNVLGKNIK